jgi:hypothetical protein
MKDHWNFVALAAAGGAAFLVLLALLRDYGERVHQAGASVTAQAPKRDQATSPSKRGLIECQNGILSVSTRPTRDQTSR